MTTRTEREREKDSNREGFHPYHQRGRKFNTRGTDWSGAPKQHEGQKSIDSLETTAGDNEENKHTKDFKGEAKMGGHKGHPNGKPGQYKAGCWECGGDHKRDSCPKLVPKTQANTVKVTCMAMQVSEPLTVQGMVGNRPVQRMLVDTGADISLIASDMVPHKTKLGKPIWVEGVGKQSQLYQTAEVPVTIQGVTEKVLMAVAPTAHIPFSVVLGRNVPGYNVTWSFGRSNKVIAAEVAATTCVLTTQRAPVGTHR